MRAGFVFAVVVAVVILTSGVLRAQEAAPSNELVQQLNSIDTGTLSVLLIFGTGLVASLCWGIGWIISCTRASGAESERVRDEVAILSARVAALEQTVGSPVGPAAHHL